MMGAQLIALPLGLLLQILIAARGLSAQATNCSLNASVCGGNSTCNSENGDLCECAISFFSISGSETDCKSLLEPEPLCSQFDPNCVFCGRNYTGPCKRCTNFLSQNSSCVESCPGKFDFVTIIVPAKICEETVTSVPFLPQWAIIIIIMGAIAILVVGAIFGLIVMVYILHKSSRGGFDIEAGAGESQNGTLRTKRSNSFSFQRKANDSVVHINDVYAADSEDSEEEIDGDDETVFRYKMDKLRGESEVFLRMLNDMRKRSRELVPDTPVAEQYKNVMRDVTRLLYLLNKKPSRLKMPVDGLQLMKWAERILKRYLASQGNTLKSNEHPSYIAGISMIDRKALFTKKLDKLRDRSEVFLRMLNEIRRRLKELRPESPVAQNYRAISKDVTRLLQLLNKRPSTVEMPMDGLELVTKTEELLNSYLTSKGEILDYQQTHGDSGVQDAETEF